MTKRNTLSVFIVVIVLALVAAITVLSLYFTGCFSETRDEPLPSPVGFEVTVGNNSYTSDVSGLVLTSGESIRILSESDYTVSIEAVTPSEDFAFYVGEEAWHWSDITGWDMTSGFYISVSGNSFNIRYGTLPQFIALVFGVSEESVKTRTAPSGDLFEMKIESGGEVLTIGFTLTDVTGNAVNVTDMELDPEQIIF